MTKAELEHFTNNNTFTSYSTILIGKNSDFRLVLMQKTYTTLYFLNGRKISKAKFDTLRPSFLDYKQVINYDYHENHVRLTYYAGVLEEIRRQYVNADGVEVLEVLNYASIGV